MPCNTNWESVIGPYDGYAWYKRCENFTKDELKNNKYIYMSFQGVDEEATVYVNGKYAFERTCKSTGKTTEDFWDVPFEGNIKPYLKAGENQIKVLVHDAGFAGGIFGYVKYIFTNDKIIHQERSMIELNPDFENMIIQATKAKNASWEGYKKETQPLVLLHFSDLHGDDAELKRLIEFYERYDYYFDDMIHTGDFCVTSSDSDFTYWEKSKAHNVLNVIGNHDAVKLSDGRFDWNNLLSDKETYNKYFAPFIKNWNVVSDGHTYYYKDYTDKKIRLVVLNVMLKDSDDAAQYKWFENVLNEAREKDLNVIIANHFAIWHGVPLKCNWNNTEWESSAWFDIIEKYEDSVDKFMDEGGQFICWFGGDTHWEFIGYGEKHKRQLSYCIDAASRRQSTQYSDLVRIDGERSQDLANAMVVDTSTNTIKLIRIGANLNSYLKQRNYITINYKTMEVVCEY